MTTIHQARKTALKLFNAELTRLRRKLSAVAFHSTRPDSPQVRGMVTRTTREISRVCGERDVVMRACQSHSALGRDVR